MAIGYIKQWISVLAPVYLLVQFVFPFPAPSILNMVKKRNHTLLKESGRGGLGDDNSCSGKPADKAFASDRQ